MSETNCWFTYPLSFYLHFTPPARRYPAAGMMHHVDMNSWLHVDIPFNYWSICKASLFWASNLLICGYLLIHGLLLTGDSNDYHIAEGPPVFLLHVVESSSYSSWCPLLEELQQGVERKLERLVMAEEVVDSEVPPQPHLADGRKDWPIG
jgi:hypothetical protein